MIRTSTKGPVWRRRKAGIMGGQNTSVEDDPKIAGDKLQGLSEHIRSNNKGDDDNEYPLLSYHQLPDYMKDNEYILDYYRANWPLKQALLSLFSWHNETLNVWTHLLGFLLFVGLTVANLVDVPQVADLITMITEQFPSTAESNISKNLSLGPTKLVDLQQQDPILNPHSTHETTTTTQWPFYVFLSGAMFCLLSSTACHLFSCHSRRLSTRLLHADYVGIAVMIVTSFFPPIYYIFQCDPRFQLLYLSAITLMGVCTVAAQLSPALSSGPKYRSLRASLFVSMGLFGLVPAAHALALNWDDPRRNVTLAYESAMAASYLVGAGFYMGRVPERWRPGRFDLAGHSHQIFHVFVVMGALAHYGAAQIFLNNRGRVGCGGGHALA